MVKVDRVLFFKCDELTNAVMPPLVQDIVTTVLWGVFVVLLVIAIRMLVTKKDDMFLLLILGALFASPSEAFLDFMTQVWYAPVGNYAVYKYFWRHVPLFIPPVFVIYFALGAYYIIPALKKNLTPSTFWKIFASLCVFDFMFQVPAVQVGMWSYFGNQPFMVLGYPLYEAFVDANEMMGWVTLVLICTELLKGYKRYLLLVLGCLWMHCAFASPLWILSAMWNVGYPTKITVFGGLAAIIYCILESYVFCHLMIFIIKNKNQTGGNAQKVLQ